VIDVAFGADHIELGVVQIVVFETDLRRTDPDRRTSERSIWRPGRTGPVGLPHLAGDDPELLRVADRVRTHVRVKWSTDPAGWVSASGVAAGTDVGASALMTWNEQLILVTVPDIVAPVIE